ncbi:MAG: trypsin-like peptidase domain-containing protein [Nitrospira sp.]|nr:trypsin-like peptidase domain-containing protein [Nitrospira sp.]MDH4305716.1 trypsin-like peptidase domain-containing protein [Nitrospira sp.]
MREPAPPTQRSRLAILLALVLLVAGLAGLFFSKNHGEESIGSRDAGPEVQPRRVSALPALGLDERATIEVFEKASPSVAFIVNSAIRRDFFSLNPIEVPQGSGSGVVWDESGHIITNFHVVYGADAILVVLGENREYEARVVGVAPDQDIAVLRIRASGDKLVPISIGSSRDLKVGQKVLAIGNPFGLDHTLTTGIVSAIGRTIKSMTGRTIEGVIQTDAAINPGNSGGPLLDSAGRLIGINTQIVSPSGGFAGIGFAVPVDMINRIVPQLIRHGKVIRAGVGVSVIPDTTTARWDVHGVVIRQVEPGGPADLAGLKGLRSGGGGRISLGDVVTAIDGEAVRTVDGLLTILDRHKVGDVVMVEVVREGRSRQVTLTLQEIE